MKIKLSKVALAVLVMGSSTQLQAQSQYLEDEPVFSHVSSSLANGWHWSASNCCDTGQETETDETGDY